MLQFTVVPMSDGTFNIIWGDDIFDWFNALPSVPIGDIMALVDHNRDIHKPVQPHFISMP